MIMGWSDIMQTAHLVMLIIICIEIIVCCSAISYCIMATRLRNRNDLGVIEKQDLNHLKKVDLIGNDNFGSDAMKQAEFMNRYAADPFKDEEAL